MNPIVLLVVVHTALGFVLAKQQLPAWLSPALGRESPYSHAELVILACLINHQDEELWGWQLCQLTGLGPGSVYPALERLAMAAPAGGSTGAHAPPGRTSISNDLPRNYSIRQ